MLDSTAEEEYLALVRAFPLVSIRDGTHLAAVLAGKRRLVLTHMERLAEHFGLPITVFLESGAHRS
ncbi:MAG TPA: hypothetical protein VF725_08220 [Ktedonobacterales bacterium]